MEQILYYIMINRWLLISFLILIFCLGIFGFLAMRIFKQESKLKIIFYGLFLQMTNLDIFKLSIIIVKSFVVFSIFLIKDIEQMYIYLTIIALLGIVYSIIYLRRIVNTVINTAIQIVGIYIAYYIKNYFFEVDNVQLVMFIYYFIIVALILFTAYSFFIEIEEITKKRAKENNEKLNINRKELEENG